MRRNDREVKDRSALLDILDRCEICRIGFWDGNEVYIVPLSFGWEEAEGVIRFYFHGAKEGRRAELIREKPKVGFELDSEYRLNAADDACGHSARFRSLIGTGTICSLENEEEKRHGLSLIMSHYTGREDWTFSDARVQAAGVYCLTVEKMTGKEHA